MAFDPVWLLLGLPLAFVLGWLASRWDFRQLRRDFRRAPKAYFQGLNFLLNEQQDQAIDVFIEAVQHDPDTSELHFALGSLFRRRGEYHRAVRVHEHLIARADLSEHDRARARHALAQDFLRAGLLSRAEEALRHLHGTAFEADARLARLAICERTCDWAQATATAQDMQQAGQGDLSARMAHYLCEEAQTLWDDGQHGAALEKLDQATRTAPSAARPWLLLAQRQQQGGQAQQALKSLRQLATQSPEALPLATDVLLDIAASDAGLRAPVQALLQAQHARAPGLDSLRALATLDANTEAASARYIAHLQHTPSLVAAAHWLGAALLPGTPHQHTVQRALEHAALPLLRYRCAACGFEARQHFWHCPGCQSWDSYPARRVEEL